jgi:hypothetical protein
MKVVTITGRLNVFTDAKEFKEVEHPTLNKYLEEGYLVKHVTKVIDPERALYSLTFVLAKFTAEEWGEAINSN